MSTIVQLTVGPGHVTLPDAVRVAAAAEATGVAAIRLADGGALDPAVVASYLAGLHQRIGYIAELPTTGNAPYNAARRVLSLDRATGGRTGVALRAGAGDEVSEPVTPDPSATGAARRWAEYAHVLTRLWESFPRPALIGDQATGVMVEDSLIRPIDHVGAFYRVAGPLDGPASVQGRPVIVADLGVLPVAAVAAFADVVVADRPTVDGADTALIRALAAAGRSREEVALLARIAVSAVDDRLPDWLEEHGMDGAEVVARDADEIIGVLHGLAPAPPQPTLRAALGLGPAPRLATAGRGEPAAAR
jgi:alkanesulfonate monooxygenase SsuD/methylene tetrahydromethanopterin reductase-like flavin-dependent oxidoreductase (luciferase family)